MARAKKKGQTLGGQLQSARAKHDTALEQEVLGKLTNKPVKERKTPKVKKPKAKAVPPNDEHPQAGKKVSRRVKQETKKGERREHKKELIDMLESDLVLENSKASALIKRANTQFTMSQMSRAAQSLHSTGKGPFTEAEYMAKVAEFHQIDKKVEDDAVQQKAARKAENESKAGPSKKAKKAAKKERKSTDSLVSESQRNQMGSSTASSHLPGIEQYLQAGEAFQDKVAQPGSDGFSKEFWMSLAGSREAAAAAAAAL